MRGQNGSTSKIRLQGTCRQQLTCRRPAARRAARAGWPRRAPPRCGSAAPARASARQSPRPPGRAAKRGDHFGQAQGQQQAATARPTSASNVKQHSLPAKQLANVPPLTHGPCPGLPAAAPAALPAPHWQADSCCTPSQNLRPQCQPAPSYAHPVPLERLLQPPQLLNHRHHKCQRLAGACRQALWADQKHLLLVRALGRWGAVRSNRQHTGQSLAGACSIVFGMCICSIICLTHDGRVALKEQ